MAYNARGFYGKAGKYGMGRSDMYKYQSESYDNLQDYYGTRGGMLIAFTISLFAYNPP